jgi:hypothetical protein
MKDTITREEALEVLKEFLKTPHLINHSLESEAVMRALARELGEDQEFWGITGLLHDLDMDETDTIIELHAKRTIQILKDKGYDIPEMFHSIEAHTETLGHTDVKRESKLDYALSAAENITGLIIANALMRPTKLEGMSVKSLNKKFKDKSFAANVNRELISDIEKVGIERSRFFEIAIKAIQDIASDIGM